MMFSGKSSRLVRLRCRSIQRYFSSKNSNLLKAFSRSIFEDGIPLTSRDDWSSSSFHDSNNPFLDILKLVGYHNKLLLKKGGKQDLLDLMEKAENACKNGDEMNIAFGTGIYRFLIGDYYNAAQILENFGTKSSSPLALKLSQDIYLHAGDIQRSLTCILPSYHQVKSGNFKDNHYYIFYAYSRSLIEIGDVAGNSKSLTSSESNLASYEAWVHHCFDAGKYNDALNFLLSSKTFVESSNLEGLQLLRIYKAIASFKLGKFVQGEKLLHEYLENVAKSSTPMNLDDLMKVSWILWYWSLYRDIGFAWISQDILDRWKLALEEYCDIMTPFQLVMAYMSISMATKYHRNSNHHYRSSKASKSKPGEGNKMPNLNSNHPTVFQNRSSVRPEELKIWLRNECKKQANSLTFENSFPSMSHLDSGFVNHSSWMKAPPAQPYRQYFLQHLAERLFDGLDAFCEEKNEDAAKILLGMRPFFEQCGSYKFWRSILHSTVIER